jgi:hypothetical protein
MNHVPEAVARFKALLEKMQVRPDLPIGDQEGIEPPEGMPTPKL